MTKDFRHKTHLAFLCVFGLAACLTSSMTQNTTIGIVVMLLGRSLWDLFSAARVVCAAGELPQGSKMPLEILCTRLISSTLFVMAAMAAALTF